MSGFVSIVNLNGAPVDRDQLDSLTSTLQFRGPDAQDVWVCDQIGFGHAMLRTTEDGSREHQPCSLNGTTWLTGDVRVDGRNELVRKLEAAGQTVPGLVNDAELILYAYETWGAALIDHLLGDFSFAIWDGRRRHFFCARDHLGVKPFFYAIVGKQLLVSNTLVCLRAHPLIPDELNDHAVGDFLLFGSNCDPSSTTFVAIKRLPGGHSLSWSPGGEPRVDRYWALPRYEELRLPRRRDYVERFQTILASAVSDRLRTDRARIHMSGGLDSTAIAATAKSLREKHQEPLKLEALTVVFDKSFHDEERGFSQLVADFLDMPIEYLSGDDYRLFDEGSARISRFPEPVDALVRPSFFDALNQQTDARCRVVLSGYDGDALLMGSWSRHLLSQARQGQVGSMAVDAFHYFQAKQKLLRAIQRRLFLAPRGDLNLPNLPRWLETGFVQRTGLSHRWASVFAGHAEGSGSRDAAYRAMILPTWFPILEGRDAGVTGVPVEHRHPLLDLRMVEFGLSLPAIPWCIDKHILREAAKGLIPEPARTRPKSALGGDPMPRAIHLWLAASKNLPLPHPTLARYIDVESLPRVIDDLGTTGYWFSLRALILNFWLYSV